MTTTRFTSAERKAFENMKPSYESTVPYIGPLEEPALGTVDERLSIILRRQGARSRGVTAGKQERAEYLDWLAENDPTATSPYAKAGR